MPREWADKIMGFSPWEGLDKHAFNSDLANQKPYNAVDDIMERVQDFGTQEVQKAFVHSIYSWLESGQEDCFESKQPDYLEEVGGYDAKPFQWFWIAMRIADVTEGIGVMAVLLNRKALVDIQRMPNKTLSKGYREKRQRVK